MTLALTFPLPFLLAFTKISQQLLYGIPLPYGTAIHGTKTMGPSDSSDLIFPPMSSSGQNNIIF